LKKRFDTRNAIYISTIFLLFVMAISSIVFYAIIDINKRQQKKTESLPALNIPTLEQLPQNAWIKQSQAKKINSIENAINNSSQKVLIDTAKNPYITIEYLAAKYNVAYNYSESDDVLTFSFNFEKVFARLGSLNILVGNTHLTLDRAPFEYDGQIYLPYSMIELFEGKNHEVFSWMNSDSKAYYNSIKKADSPPLLKFKFESFIVSAIDSYSEEVISTFDYKTMTVNKIQPINITNKYYIFVNKNDNCSLLELKAGALEEVREFPTNAAVSLIGESIYWQDNDNLHFYNMIKGSEDFLNKKDFQNGFFESIFGVGNVSIIDINFVNSANYFVDFVDSNSDESCIVKNEDDTKQFLNINLSPNRSYFFKKGDNSFEVYEKSTGEKLWDLSIANAPVWINDKELIYSSSSMMIKVDVISGVQTRLENSQRFFDDLLKNKWQPYSTKNFLVLVQQSGSEAIIQFTGNDDFSKVSKEFHILIDSKSSDFKVVQKGKCIILSDKSSTWLINTTTGEVFSGERSW